MERGKIIKHFFKNLSFKAFGREVVFSFSIKIKKNLIRHRYDTIISLYREGEAIKNIAKKVGVAPNHVLWILDKEGIRPRERRLRRGWKLPADAISTIKELRIKGESLQEIGDKFCISSEGVRQAINKVK